MSEAIKSESWSDGFRFLPGDDHRYSHYVVGEKDGARARVCVAAMHGISDPAALVRSHGELVAALEFYANIENWKCVESKRGGLEPSEIDNDSGGRAITALAHAKEVG